MARKLDSRIDPSEIYIKFSDFHKDVPYRFIIDDIFANELLEVNTFKGEKNHYFLFNARLAEDKKQRPFKVIFPARKFGMAFTNMKMPTSQRNAVGRYSVFVEIYKKKYGRIEITKFAKWRNVRNNYIK